MVECYCFGAVGYSFVGYMAFDMRLLSLMAGWVDVPTQIGYTDFATITQIKNFVTR